MRRVNRHRALPVVLVAALAFGAVGCDVSIGGSDFSLGVASGRATDEWSRKYQVASGGRFEVVNVNGQVQVEQATGSDVEVRAERIAKASTDEAAKELLGKVEMAETKTADGVKLETKAPKNWGRGGVEVKYFVKVPAGVKVSAQTTNGGIRLLNISNEVVAVHGQRRCQRRRTHRRGGRHHDQRRHRPVAWRGGPGRRQSRDRQRRRRRLGAA